MFYDQYILLCAQKGVAPSKAALDNGVSKTSVTRWKNGAKPSAEILSKFAEYFDVSVDFLLGKEQKNKPTDDNVSELRPELYDALRILNSLPDDIREQEIARLKVLSDAINRNNKD